MCAGSLSHTHVAHQGHSRVCGAGASSGRGRNVMVPPHLGDEQFFDGVGGSKTTSERSASNGMT